MSFVFFAAPLVQKAYILTALDASFMLFGFFGVMLAEGLTLTVLMRLERKWQYMPITSFLLAAGLMALNVFHFFFVVSNSMLFTLLIIVMISSTMILACFWSAKANDFLLWLCGVMLLVMCGTEWVM